MLLSLVLLLSLRVRHSLARPFRLISSLYKLIFEEGTKLTGSLGTVEGIA
jgi:hypothetical protein